MTYKPPTILALASYFKGQRLLEAYKNLGCRVILLAAAHLQKEPWPSAADEKLFLPNFDNLDALLRTVSYLARERPFEVIVPLEEYMIQPAALVRAHLGCFGMDEAVARRVRDKLTMRWAARKAGLATPRFVGLLNYATISQFLQDVPPPWILKPRLEGGSVQMKKLHHQREVWDELHRLGDSQSWFLLEEFVTGHVYHVDSVYHRGRVLFAQPNRYSRPPFSVWHGGGVFGSQTVSRESSLGRQLLERNQEAVTALSVVNGVAHTEFIVDEEGEIYFLELGARLPGAHLDRLVEYVSGLNLAAEQARLDVCALRGEPYEPPSTTHGHGGIVLCLSKDERPDLSGFSEPEVVWTLAEHHHAGLIVKGEEQRVKELVERYSEELQRDFLAVLPPSDKPA